MPWDHPNLSNRSTATSPFTIVFKEAGSSTYLSLPDHFFLDINNIFAAVAASFMNTVVLTSVLSAGNHALFAGTRVLYGVLPFGVFSSSRSSMIMMHIGLSVTTPRQAPKLLSWTNSSGIPIPALLATSSISVLCFASSFVGSGELWGWLQNIVGVSNQVLY